MNVQTTGVGSLSVFVNGSATITGTSLYGILANSSLGVLDISTAPGVTINSGSYGILALNQASSVPQADNSSISVSTAGTINSGSLPSSSGFEPGGISTGYKDTAGTPTTTVFGNVNVNNSANITAAAGYGIDAYDFGVGNVTVSDGSGTTITATAAGNDTAAGFAQYGIAAFAYENGNVNVTAGSGSTINSGSVGIFAENLAGAAAASSVTVVGLGSISSGVNSTNGGAAPAGITAAVQPNSGTAFDANVNGNVFVDFAGTSINAGAGDGIKAFNYGVGNVTVDVGSGANITATQSATAATNNAPYGIGAFNYGPGNVEVTTSSGDTITSGSSGIELNNQATTIASASGALVTVTAAGTINAGTILTNSQSPPSGISAGFLGGTTATSNTGVDGNVIVNNDANINATNSAPSSYGINAYNYGQGDVTVNDASSTTVTGAVDGITAAAKSGGTGNVFVNVASNATINGTSSYGILAESDGTGNVSVITSSGDAINSGSAGIIAVDDAATIAAGASVVVSAAGSINSGAAVLSGGGNIAAGIVADYNPGLADSPDNNVQGNISIADYASISSPTGTDGIRGDNYGIGTVTIVAEAGATINAGRYGIGAFEFDGGDLSLTNYATVTGGTAAIDATTTSAGTAVIDNYGHLIGDVIAYNATFTNESGELWSLSGGVSSFGGASIFINAGDLQSTGASEISGLSNFSNSSTIEVQSGTLKLDTAISGTGTLTIDAGATLEVTSGVTSGQTVAFSSTTGMLKLDQAENFNGVISGFSTTDGTQANSDQIDLADINHRSLSFSEQFNSATDTLTVTDGTNTAVIYFTGTVGNLNFVGDGNLVGGVSGTSGTIVYDPPSTGQGVGPVVMHDPGQGVPAVTMQDPGPAANTIVANAPNQTSSGFGDSDNFEFNFDRFGHSAAEDFHPHSDVHQFDELLFANAQAILNDLHDDGHGNTAIAADGHETTSLGGVLKAQTHAADFHFI